MANIDIDLIDPSGRTVRVRLPDDRPISRLSEAICRKLSLSTAGDHGSLRVTMQCHTSGRSLHSDMTLAEEGIRDGHTLLIRLAPAGGPDGVVVITERDLSVDDAGGGQGRVCSGCGVDLSPMARFCQRCGRVVDTMPPRPARPVPRELGMGPFGRKRSPVRMFVLLFVTVGLYGIGWFVAVWSEARRYAHGRNGVRINRPFTALLLHVLLPLLLAIAGISTIAWADRVYADNSRYYYHLRSRGFPEYWGPPPYSTRVADNAVVTGGFCLGIAMILGLLGNFRTPGLIRKMRLAMGVPKELAGHPGLIGLCSFIPFFGALIWLGVTQLQLNQFWRNEAVR